MSFDGISGHDLVIHAIGRLIDTWRLGNDDEMLSKRALADIIGQRAIEQAISLGIVLDRTAAENLGSKIVDILVNAKNRSAPFRESIYDAAKRKHETFESDDNKFYLEPTVEASNHYFQSFVTDIKDVLIAQKALLEHHIAGGRIDSLCDIAEQHCNTATQLITEARSVAKRAERSIRSISPDKDAIPLLLRFRAAAEEAAHFDDGIAFKISEQLDIAEGETFEHLQRTEEVIRRARKSFQSARQIATELIAKLEKASTSAAFKLPSMLAVIPDIEVDIAHPLFGLSCDDSVFDLILGHFLGPSFSRSAIIDPCGLAEAWVPNPLLEKQEDWNKGDPELEDIVTTCPPRFGDKGELIEEATAIIKAYGVQSGRLSALLLNQAIKANPGLEDAIVLVTLAAFKDQGAQGNDLVRFSGIYFGVDGGKIPEELPFIGDDITFEAVE